MRPKLIFILISFCAFHVSCTPKASTNTPGSAVNEESSQEVAATRLWKDSAARLEGKDCPGKVLPTSFRLLENDTAMIKRRLVIHGSSPGVISPDTVMVEIPIPDGSWEVFKMTQVQVIAPELAAKYPYLKTYSGTSQLYPADQIRLEVSPDGIRCMILSSRGTILLDPFCKEDKLHTISFFKKNLPEGGKEDFEK